jgi:hypothetical protein
MRSGIIGPCRAVRHDRVQDRRGLPPGQRHAAMRTQRFRRDVSVRRHGPCRSWLALPGGSPVWARGGGEVLGRACGYRCLVRAEQLSRTTATGGGLDSVTARAGGEHDLEDALPSCGGRAGLPLSAQSSDNTCLVAGLAALMPVLCRPMGVSDASSTVPEDSSGRRWSGSDRGSLGFGITSQEKNRSFGSSVGDWTYRDYIRHRQS